MKGVSLPTQPGRYNYKAVYRLGSHHLMDGKPVCGGAVYVYLSGTTIAAQVFVDEQMSIRSAHPVQLNTDGEANIYVEPGQVLTVQIRAVNSEVVSQYETRS